LTIRRKNPGILRPEQGVFDAIFKDDGENSYTFDRLDYIALENFIKKIKARLIT
jgi:hypothetical protein